MSPMQMEEQDLLLDEQPPAGLSPAELAYWERIRERLVRGMQAYRAANYVSEQEWELRLTFARDALSAPMPAGIPYDLERAEGELLHCPLVYVPDLSEQDYTHYFFAGIRKSCISVATERRYSQSEAEALYAQWCTP